MGLLREPETLVGAVGASRDPSEAAGPGAAAYGDEELFLMCTKATQRCVELETSAARAEAESASLRSLVAELRQEAVQRAAAGKAEASVLGIRIEELEREKKKRFEKQPQGIYIFQIGKMLLKGFDRENR